MIVGEYNSEQKTFVFGIKKHSCLLLMLLIDVMVYGEMVKTISISAMKRQRENT